MYNLQNQTLPPSHPRRKRKGATPLSFAIWFILSLVVIVGILTSFQAARDGLRASALRTQLVRAQSVIEQAHSYSGVFGTGSLLLFLADEGFTDRELVNDEDDGWVFTSPYDTDIEITGDGARNFTILINALPTKGCRSALLAFQESGAGLDSALVVAVDVTVPIEIANVQTLCDAGGDAQNVSLTF